MTTSAVGAGEKLTPLRRLRGEGDPQQLLVLGVGGGPSSGPGLNTSARTDSISGPAGRTAPKLLVGLAPNGVSSVSVTFANGHT